MKKFNNWKKWLTLIELVIVIWILSILLVTWFLILTKRVWESRDARRLQDISAIKEALKVNYVDQTTDEDYPFPSENNDGSPVKEWIVNWKTVAFKWTFWSGVTKKMTSMSTAPKDPIWKRYAYWITSDKDKYQVSTVLENWVKISYHGDLLNKSYAWKKQAYVNGNYENMIKYTTWSCKENGILLNIPSLIFDWRKRQVYLKDKSVLYVINKWKNYPYRLSEKKKNRNISVEDLLKNETWVEWSVRWLNISKVKSKDELIEKFWTWTIKLFWWDLDKIYSKKNSKCVENSVNYCTRIEWMNPSEVFNYIAWEDGKITPIDIKNYLFCIIKWDSDYWYVITWINNEKDSIIFIKKNLNKESSSDSELPESWSISWIEYINNKEKIANNIENFEWRIVTGGYLWSWGGINNWRLNSLIWGFWVWWSWWGWIWYWWFWIGLMEEWLPSSWWSSKILSNKLSIYKNTILNNISDRRWTEVHSYWNWWDWIIAWKNDWNIVTINKSNIWEKFTKDELWWANRDLIIAGILDNWSDILFMEAEGKNWNWNEAKNDCEWNNSSWTNWRLTPKQELNIINRNKDGINDKLSLEKLKNEVYWSSTNTCDMAFWQNLENWNKKLYNQWESKNYHCVKSFKKQSYENNIPWCISFWESKVLTGTQAKSRIEKISNIDNKIDVNLEGKKWNPKYRVCNDNSCDNTLTDWVSNTTKVGSWSYLQMRMNSSLTEGVSYTGALNIWLERAVWKLTTKGKYSEDLEIEFSNNDGDSIICSDCK